MLHTGEIMLENILSQVGIFALESFIVVLSIAAVLLIILLFSARNKFRPEVEIKDVSEGLKQIKESLEAQVLNKKDFKKLMKLRKKEDKQKDDTLNKKMYLLEFDGDIKASQVESLRKEITAVLQIAKKEDEVLIKLTSPGGAVNSYGLAASQLARIREAQIPLTIAVDQVAASGGYMMACLATQIIAAPFAILGSIGVVAQLPNFNKLLKKHNVDYQEVTAGEFKRTVSIFGEITDQGMNKFKSQLEDTHILFKEFVKNSRPQLNINEVATGEYWYGSQALKLGLIDKIQTSDDYILKQSETYQIFKIKCFHKKHLSEKIAEAMQIFVTKFRTHLNYEDFGS